MLDDDGHGIHDIHIRATRHQAGQRPHRRSVGLARAGDGFRQLVLSQHACPRSHVALAYLIDPRHAEERRRVPAAEGDRQAGHRRVGEPARAGDAVHQPLRAGDHRGDHQGAGARLPGPRDGGLGPALPHRDPGHAIRARGSRSSGTCSRRGPAAAPRRRATAGRPRASGRRRAASSSAASRWPRRASRCSSRATNSGPDSGGRRAVPRRAGLGARDGAWRSTEPARRQHRGRRRALWRLRHAGRQGRAAASLSAAFARPARPRVLKTKEVGIADPPGRRVPDRVRWAAAAGAIRRGASADGARRATWRRTASSPAARDAGGPEHAADRHRRRRHLHRPGRGGRRGPRRRSPKSASTPADPSHRRDGRTRPAGGRARHRPRPRCSRDTERIVHGTTVATNALLERKGARVGLLTTAGHRDVIEMREGLKDDRYNLRMPPPVQLVPRARAARRDASGCAPTARVETPLDEASLEAAIRRLEARGRRGGGGLLSARLARSAPRAGDRAGCSRGALPDAYVSLSSEVLPQIKEYERFCTTVVNAYVGPVLARYLRSLGERLTEGGLRAADVLIIQSHGGVATDRRVGAARRGRGAVGPGGRRRGQPARRAAARRRQPDPVRHGRHQHRHLPCSRTASRTSPADKAVGGQQGRAAQPRHPQPRRGRRLDRARRRGRHPACRARRAPARCPGPACYGRGGTAATVTDANLVLGLSRSRRISSAAARGSIATAAARRASSGMARRLGVDRIAGGGGHPPRRQHQHGRGHPAGLGAPRRRPAPLRPAVVRRRGRAARDRCRAPARDLTRVVVPRVAAVLSAWGMLATDLRFEFVRTHIGEAAPGRRRAPAAALRRDGGGGPAAARRVVRGPGATCAARWTCATASRSSRSRCRSTASTWRRRT